MEHPRNAFSHEEETSLQSVWTHGVALHSDIQIMFYIKANHETFAEPPLPSARGTVLDAGVMMLMCFYSAHAYTGTCIPLCLRIISRLLQSGLDVESPMLMLTYSSCSLGFMTSPPSGPGEPFKQKEETSAQAGNHSCLCFPLTGEHLLDSVKLQMS